MDVCDTSVQLDNHTATALRFDGLLQRYGIGGLSGRQHDQEALCGKLLGDGAADTPAYAHGRSLSSSTFPVCQLSIAAIGLPLGGRPHHDGDRLTGCGSLWIPSLLKSAAHTGRPHTGAPGMSSGMISIGIWQTARSRATRCTRSRPRCGTGYTGTLQRSPSSRRAALQPSKTPPVPSLPRWPPSGPTLPHPATPCPGPRGTALLLTLGALQRVRHSRGGRSRGAGAEMRVNFLSAYINSCSKARRCSGVRPSL